MVFEMPGLSGVDWAMKGGRHLLKTPELMRVVICPLIAALVLGLAALIAMLAKLMPPIADYFEDDQGLKSGWAWVVALILTLMAFAVAMLLIMAVVFHGTQEKLFNKVYNANMSPEVRTAMQFKKLGAGHCNCGVSRLDAITGVLFLVTLPLQLVFPLSLATVWINGPYYAWDLHANYMAFHGVRSFKDQKKLVAQDTWYQDYGITAALIESLPGVGFFFFFVTPIGAALYAAEKEPARNFVALQLGPKDGDPEK